MVRLDSLLLLLWLLLLLSMQVSETRTTRTTTMTTARTTTTTTTTRTTGDDDDGDGDIRPAARHARSRTGTSQRHTTTGHAPRPSRASRPPSRAALSPAPTPRLIALGSDSTARLPRVNSRASLLSLTPPTGMPALPDPPQHTQRRDPALTSPRDDGRSPASGM